MGSIAEAETEVKLLVLRPSPYSQRVQIALREKGIPFEPTFITFPKPQILLDSNPLYRQVPVLFHKGRALSQSLVILEYLEDVFPENTPLMPKDHYEKAQVRFWADFLHRGYSSLVDTCLKLKPGCPPKADHLEKAAKFMRMVDAAMRSFSTEGPFFTGSEFGFLDAVLAPFTTSLQMLERLDGFAPPGPDEIPRMHKWIEVIRARPSVVATIPPVEEHVAFADRVFHNNPVMQSHLQELHGPLQFPHPSLKSTDSMVMSAHILVYES